MPGSPAAYRRSLPSSPPAACGHRSSSSADPTGWADGSRGCSIPASSGSCSARGRSRPTAGERCSRGRSCRRGRLPRRSRGSCDRSWQRATKSRRTAMITRGGRTASHGSRARRCEPRSAALRPSFAPSSARPRKASRHRGGAARRRASQPWTRRVSRTGAIRVGRIRTGPRRADRCFGSPRSPLPFRPSTRRTAT